MGVATKLIPKRRHRASRWSRRLTAAVLAGIVAVALSVVLSQTSIVSKITSQDTAPVAAEAGPTASVPAVEARIPTAVEPAPAVVEPIAVVRRAPLADRYPGALLDAPLGTSAAYQRAAAIINLTADCHLDWLTLAAIARIESNHGLGEDGTHKVDLNGLVTPALVGQPLNGQGGRGTVDDTDAGKIDHDLRWDAPVGPFGLMPATWAAVAVDADGDDVRNPQDVDDASLAAAVVLCAGGRDMADAKVLAKALTGYHQTPGFAATVVQLTAVYADEMTSVPVFLPLPASMAIPDNLAEICGCARAKSAVVGSDATPPPSGEAPPVEEPTPPAGPGDTGSEGTGASGDPVDPPAEQPSDPGPSTEPEPEPAPVDPPAETPPPPPAPEPAPEPAPQESPAPSDERTAEPAAEPATEPAAEAAVEPAADAAPTA